MWQRINDKRILFCLATYAKSIQGEEFLNGFFKDAHPQLLACINGLKNGTIKQKNSKYEVNFLLDTVNKRHYELKITKIEGKVATILSIPYVNFYNEFLCGNDSSKTLIKIEQKTANLIGRQKPISKEILFFEKNGDDAVINFVADKGSHHTQRIFNYCKACRELLLEEQEYVNLDKKNFIKRAMEIQR